MLFNDSNFDESPNMPPDVRERLIAQEERAHAIMVARHEENLRCEHLRTRANRANARFSTGPRTLTGKEISSLNAVTHGLTGRQVLLPSEDAAAYTEHLERFRRDHAPATERELELTQMLADTQWRLNRIPGLESSIYAMGRIRYVDLFLNVMNEDLRRQLIDCYTMEQSAKQLKNLSLQEGRLRRQYDKDLKELQVLQGERREREKAPPKPLVTMTATASPGSSWVRFYDSTEPLADEALNSSNASSEPPNKAAS